MFCGLERDNQDKILVEMAKILVCQNKINMLVLAGTAD